MKRFFLLPGLVFEGAGVLVIVAGALNGNNALLLVGAGICCIAALVNISRFMKLRRTDSSASAPDATGQAVSDPRLLYADNLVRISDDSITFRHYSFTELSPRSVLFTDIDHISVKGPSLTTGKWRIWGSGDLSTWFPLDGNRSSRDRIFHARLKTRGMNVGFTVEDSTRVMSILKEKGLLIDQMN
jgi:hypothetical protein